MYPDFYFQQYESIEPNPEHGTPVRMTSLCEQDRTTVALLHRFNFIAYTGAAAFLDILIRHALNICRQAWAPMDSNPNGTTELDILTALDGFRRLCGEVRTVISDTINYWDKAADTLTNLSNRDGTLLPILWSLVSLAALRRQVLFTDFPSLRAKGEQNVHEFSDAYHGLEATIAEIEVARTSAPVASAILELRRNSKIALFALSRLEAIFRRYKLGWIMANGLLGEAGSYSFTLQFETPIRTILIGENWS
ncbi:hypothetical protein GGX14DRAFT_664253 [Mycena pura]|uniref:Uncharacterized protein n=1 Tax=Mycena pura TaxID=153505 RepID=A0AAD6YLI4_9AGAR|nr:hypothetical protein GGX14DRAFT_664253 [Mycena pura]